MPPVTVARSGPVARITLDRPPLNVIDLATARELAAAAEGLRLADDLCAVVIEAKGKAFSAGVDVRDHLPDRGAEMVREFHRACLAIGAIEAPTVAVVDGAALGGGCELTLMCDLVWAGAGATFALPEIKLGVFPPLAAAGLARIVSPHVAAEMILTGRTLTASEAQQIGLVNHVAHENDLAEAVERLLVSLTALSPSSLRTTKRVLALAQVRPSAAEIEAAERIYMECLLHDRDAIEGLTAFMEKRKPAWSKG